MVEPSLDRIAVRYDMGGNLKSGGGAGHFVFLLAYFNRFLGLSVKSFSKLSDAGLFDNVFAVKLALPNLWRQACTSFIARSICR